MKTVAGYSGTPLAKKLGIKSGGRLMLVGAPENYRRLLEPLPEAVRFVPELSGDTDLVHVFTTKRATLQKALKDCRRALGPDATVWVSWPKKASKVATEVTGDTVRELALPLGFVDVKVCAVDEVWSGLKLVVRKQLRGT